MSSDPLSLVAIGASAGGIEAFHQFFDNMPSDSGLAFVVVLHLAAGRRSMLPEILARWTSMPVTEASDGVPIRADQVLVIPAGTIAELRDGHLVIRKMAPDEPRALAPIDGFFDSVASTLSEDAIGVVLSGTGHDGSLGLKAIRARGGLTLSQGSNGSRPEYAGMPSSAVAAGGVDLYVPVEDMPGHILAARQVRLTSPSAPGCPADDDDKIRLKICDIVRSRLGHDFNQYKHQTFMRRVQRRMQVLRLLNYEAYIQWLENDRGEVTLLFSDLLISVTSFFRDASTFTALERDIIPRLFQNKDATDEVRIWVPGCATGEEAYSLAILVREYTETLSVVPKIQIFASDIDETSIGTARTGRFPATLLDGMSPQRLERFFSKGADGYVVRKEVRELCIFYAHSLIRDPPFSRIDMISCRNLLIYMNNDLQDRVIPIFHYALVPDGILVLGSSETIARNESLFQSLDRSNRIFVRRDSPSDVTGVYRATSGGLRVPPGQYSVVQAAPNGRRSNAVAIARRQVLARFSSPFVVITVSGEIVHASGRLDRFLRPMDGVQNANLFHQACPGWPLELRAALRRCRELGGPVEQVRTVVAPDGEKGPPVKLVVEPLSGSEPENLYMVAFVDMGSERSIDESGAAVTEPEANELNAQLERENRDLREQLQSVNEEHATAIEELRSSNEELQSVNEELQSTNEELETSREEIQSINEELNAVNVQLSAKIEQVDRTNSDLKNLFESTKVATIFLDAFFIIRSFTPEIARIYNLIPSDVGRPLSDIVSQLSYTTIKEDVQTVLQTLQPLEKRVEQKDRSAHYLMRILPYRSAESVVDGSLITFVDVTSMVRAEEHQRLLVDELNHRVKNMLTVVISLATNTIRRATTLEDFREVFLGRIHALTAAYALLSRDAWSPILLREILMEELRPFMSPDRASVELTGPAVLLEPRAALAMGMAAYELTTNAVKYGALSDPEGHVDITWTVEKSDTGQELVLRWIERNGPPVTARNLGGFGMTLIERVFTHDVGGTAKVELPPEGAIATLRAPLPNVQTKGMS